jgi:hypothetical protein
MHAPPLAPSMVLKLFSGRIQILSSDACFGYHSDEPSSNQARQDVQLSAPHPSALVGADLQGLFHMDTLLARYRHRFSWKTYDIGTLLPQHWQAEILNVAASGKDSVFIPNAVTSRERQRYAGIPICDVDGRVVRETLPWLYALYQGEFLELAQAGSIERVSTAKDDRYGVVLNILKGNKERYVCHVDSNPLAGLLYVTTHPAGSGGELVVANSTTATCIEDVDRDCTTIFPAAGQLLFFDGRMHAHYVRPLQSGTNLRVVVAMNFYTTSAPESCRPASLDLCRLT